MTDRAGPEGAAHQTLPAAGWYPDPAQPHLERYWNGWVWTEHTRDPNAAAPAPARPGYASGTYASGTYVATSYGHFGADAGARRSATPMLLSLLAVAAGALFAVAAFTGSPSWMPGAKDKAAPPPVIVDTDYPVFGSTDLVTHLAHGMVAQQEALDVTWLVTPGTDIVDTIDDAMGEALTQNPYAYASGWRTRIEADKVQVFPDYTYSAEEAERRRVATASAVAAVLANPAKSQGGDVRAIVGGLHDAVVQASSYDDAAAQEIRTGGRPESSPTVARSQEAFGALVEGTAVCTGYAKAFHLLAEASGLTSVVVTGEAMSGVTTGDHAWNLVLVGDQWLVVDTTWDDSDDALPQRDYVLMDPADPQLMLRNVDLFWVVDANVELYQ